MPRIMFSTPLMDISQISRKWLDVPYAERTPSQIMDIYLPETGEGPFPVIISLHDGAWLFGDKRDISNNIMMQGLSHGYAVACVEYRLAGEAKFPSQIHDSKAAIRYLRANAARYLLDGNRIIAGGGTAGGYLAALLGTSAGVKELEDLSMGNAEVSAEIQAVVCWNSPLQNFLEIDAQLRENGGAKADHNEEDSPESRLLGTGITRVPDLVRTASPMTYLSPTTPHFFILHGSVDNEVPVQQSIHFAAEMSRIAGWNKVTFEIMAGVGHVSPVFETHENIQKIFDFLDAHIQKGPGQP